MSPISGASLSLKDRSPRPQLTNIEDLQMRVADLASNWSSSDKVDFSLDSVMFWDRTYIGPDATGKVARLDREYRPRCTIARK
jgi:hypothetical protein